MGCVPLPLRWQVISVASPMYTSPLKAENFLAWWSGAEAAVDEGPEAPTVADCRWRKEGMGLRVCVTSSKEAWHWKPFRPYILQTVDT